jgi:hypothetical protein
MTQQLAFLRAGSKDCNPTAIEEAIDGMEVEPVRRQIGAGLSEEQWCRSHVNCRYVHCYTFFPSPYARLAGLDDTVEERYTVCTGSVNRDDVPNAQAHSGVEDDGTDFLQFPTLEGAVAFCLEDGLAPMEIELYRTLLPVSAP